jgi:hypothetical protein
VEKLKRFLIKCSAPRVGEIKENNFDSAAGGNGGREGGKSERRRARGMICCCQPRSPRNKFLRTSFGSSRRGGREGGREACVCAFRCRNFAVCSSEVKFSYVILSLKNRTISNKIVPCRAYARSRHVKRVIFVATFIDIRSRSYDTQVCQCFARYAMDTEQTERNHSRPVCA